MAKDFEAEKKAKVYGNEDVVMHAMSAADLLQAEDLDHMPSPKFDALTEQAAQCIAQGRLEEGIELLQQVVKQEAKELGADDAHTLLSELNLVQAYFFSGRTQEAHALGGEVYAKFCAKEGEHSPNSINALFINANIYIQEEQYARAMELAAKALDLAEEYLPAQHPLIYNIFRALPTWYMQLKQYDLAIKTQERYLARARRELGEDATTMRARQLLAQMKWQSGRHAAAFLDMEDIILRLKSSCGEEGKATLEAQECLADWYAEDEQYDRAVELYEIIYASNKAKIGANPFTLHDLRTKLVVNYRQLEKTAPRPRLIAQKILPLVRETYAMLLTYTEENTLEVLSIRACVARYGIYAGEDYSEHIEEMSAVFRELSKLYNATKDEKRKEKIKEELLYVQNFLKAFEEVLNEG